MLAADGDPLHAEVETALARGSLALEVTFEQQAPGPRLHLGWTRPDGRSERIQRRHLGPPLPAWKWWLTDILAWVAALAAGALARLAPGNAPRRLPVTTAVSWPRSSTASAGLLVLLAVMSWPLVSISPAADRWIALTAGSTPGSWPGPAARLERSDAVFQAPAFHPLPDALAFSENLLLPAASPRRAARSAARPRRTTSSCSRSLLLSGLGTHLLVRRAGGDRLAAFVAGAFFAAGPHRWTRLAHLHAQVTVFLPFVLLALDRFWERRTLRRALVVGPAARAAGAGVRVPRGDHRGGRSRRRSPWPSPAGCARASGAARGRLALAAASCWPAVAPYLRMRAFQGEEWDAEAVANYAATLPSYAAAGRRLWGWLTRAACSIPRRVRDTLFPGLAVAGPRRRRPRRRATPLPRGRPRRVAGRDRLLAGSRDRFYRFLNEHVVLVRGVRALARFALVPSLALSVLAGLALSGRRRWLAAAALAGR